MTRLASARRTTPTPCVQRLRFGVQGSGFRVKGLGFGVWGLASRYQGLGSRVCGVGFRVNLHHRVRSEERHGGVLPVLHLTVARFGIRVYDLGVRVSGLGFRVWGLGFRFWGLGLTSFRTARNLNVMAGIVRG